MLAHERILVPLDYDNADAALRLVAALKGKVGGFKVGLELVNHAGFDIFDRLRDAGADRIFYDAKFHDIPNTVAGAVRAAALRGVWMVNVHASGGTVMLQAAWDAAHTVDTPPLLIGVTVLTSMSQAVMNTDVRVPGTIVEQVTHLSRLSQATGLDGVVASPLEIKAIRAACGSDFITVIPGVRPAGAAINDQARVATPGSAVASGATYLVIGRPINAAPDPVQAAEDIAAEIAAVAI